MVLQAGFFLWRLLFPDDKKSIALREEAMKLEAIEVLEGVRTEPVTIDLVD